MSHNTIEVNNTAPDRVGDISLSSSTQYAVFGRGQSSAYSNSPATGISSGDSFYFYDTAPVNTITGATFTVTSNWCASFTLPTGKYIVNWSFHLESTSSSWYARLDLVNSSSTIQGRSVIGASNFAVEQSNSWGTAYLNITAASNTFSFEIGGGSQIDTIANQSTTPSEYSAFYIMKVD